MTLRDSPESGGTSNLSEIDRWPLRSNSVWESRFVKRRHDISQKDAEWLAESTRGLRRGGTVPILRESSAVLDED
jgi:hypothetical protein